jgi:hypothetical protein
MQAIQWTIAAGTAIFVALVGYFQWRTAQQKAVLDLFDRRHAIYEIVRKAVGTMVSSSTTFDQSREIEFVDAMERTLFFFGDDVENYIRELWSDITAVTTADAERQGPADNETRRKIIEKRLAALDRIKQFPTVGQPLFARYMRFSQTVPSCNIANVIRKAVGKPRRTR